MKYDNFKTCDQSGFCKRNRAFADAVVASSPPSVYRIGPGSAIFIDGQFQAVVSKNIADGTIVQLPLNVTFLKSGLVRVTLDEERRRTGDIELRHGSKARKERYNESPDWALVGGLDVDRSAQMSDKSEEGVTTIQYGDNKRNTAIIRHNPLNIEFQRGGETQIIFNRRGFLNIEHWRPKTEVEEGAEKPGTEDESTWWEESFGGNTDTKPKGPESMALDITFPGYEFVFGIPEHTGPLSLRQTRYTSESL